MIHVGNDRLNFNEVASPKFQISPTVPPLLGVVELSAIRFDEQKWRQ